MNAECRIHGSNAEFRFRRMRKGWQVCVLCVISTDLDSTEWLTLSCWSWACWSFRWFRRLATSWSDWCALERAISSSLPNLTFSASVLLSSSVTSLSFRCTTDSASRCQINHSNIVQNVIDVKERWKHREPNFRIHALMDQSIKVVIDETEKKI